MQFRTIDFETTGLPPEAAVCEIGVCDLVDGEIDQPYSFLVNPGRPIELEARAVHHISDADVVQAMPAAEGLAKIIADDDVTAYVAHNVDFESKFIKPPKPWICTLKVGRRLWPDSPSHKNQVLRYYLGLDDQPDFAAEHSMPVHRAGADAYVTMHIFKKALELASVEDMIDWTKKPSLLIKCTFKKHKGELWKNVPKDYMRWFLTQKDPDPDVLYTCKYYLGMAA